MSRSPAYSESSGPRLGFGELLTIYQIPQMVSDVILGITASAVGALILISVWETFIGMWMNTMPQIIIMTPIYLQIIQAVGVDPITFGIIFTLNCEVGFVTPHWEQASLWRCRL